MLKQLFCLCALTLFAFANVTAEEKDESKEVQFFVTADDSQPEGTLVQNDQEGKESQDALACSCKSKKSKKE